MDEISDNAPVQTGAISTAADWFVHPFTSNMTALHWFLFLGLVLIAIFLWTRILNMIVE